MINRTRKLRQDVQRLLREDYSQRKEQLETLPLRIATERSRLTAPAGAKVEEYQHDPTNPYGLVYLRYIEPQKPERTGTRKRKGGGT